MKGQDLDVFKKSHALVLKIYKETTKFPADEKYGLVSQMRRAAYSIPMNITEGSGRKSKKELIHFLSICSGSCEEVKYQLLLSKDLGYMDEVTYNELNEGYIVVSKMLFNLSKSLSGSPPVKPI